MSDYIVNPGPKGAVAGLRAAVTTDSSIVTEEVLKVLRGGGNAVDASITGCLVQAAVEPFVTNHAGLISFLFYDAKSGTVYQLDSLGGFPSGLPPFKPVPSGAGPYAMQPPSAIIPGFMPGLKAIYETFASRSWSELCAPAVKWAEQGHIVSSFEYGMNLFGESFITYFPDGREFYQPNGFFPNVGDKFVPKGLASTLRGVAEYGPDYMITGPWAREFVRTANEMGWRITLEHMTETSPRWVEPVHVRHNEYEVVSLGPPQVQGVFISIVMGILQHLGVSGMEPGSADYIWAMSSALRQGTRHWEYVQDDQIYDVPMDVLLDNEYHAYLARLVQATRPKADLREHIRLASGAGFRPEFQMRFAEGGNVKGLPRVSSSYSDQPSGSCELAITDLSGNWVQMMNTLQGSGIPGAVVGGVPMVGSHASFGSLSSPMDATLVKGAKGRCIIGNTFVLKDGMPIMSAGSPGNVFCTVPQVLTYALDLKMQPYDAVDAPRMLPMAESRSVTIEDRLRAGVVEDLHKMGVRVGVTSGYDPHMGSFSVIERDGARGTYTAVADPRRCAVADGLR